MAAHQEDWGSGEGRGAAPAASIGITSAKTHGVSSTNSVQLPNLPGVEHGDAPRDRAVPRRPLRALSRGVGCNCCLVQVHMWGTHRHKPLSEIPIDDSSSLTPVSSAASCLFDRLGWGLPSPPSAEKTWRRRWRRAMRELGHAC